MDRKEFLSQFWNRLSGKLIGIAVLVLLYIVVKIILEMIDGFNSTTIDWSAMALTIAGIAGIIIALAILYLITEYIRRLSNRLYLKLPDSVKFTLRIARRTLNTITTVALGALLYHFWIKEPFQTFCMLIVLLITTVKDSISKEKETKNVPTDTTPQT